MRSFIERNILTLILVSFLIFCGLVGWNQMRYALDCRANGGIVVQGGPLGYQCFQQK